MLLLFSSTENTNVQWKWKKNVIKSEKGNSDSEKKKHFRILFVCFGRYLRGKQIRECQKSSLKPKKGRHKKWHNENEETKDMPKARNRWCFVRYRKQFS